METDCNKGASEKHACDDSDSKRVNTDSTDVMKDNDVDDAGNVSGMGGSAAQELANEIPPTIPDDVTTPGKSEKININEPDVCAKEIIDALRSAVIDDNSDALRDAGNKDIRENTAAVSAQKLTEKLLCDQLEYARV